MYSALEKLLGDKVSGLSASNVSRMKQIWKSEYETWQKRDLSLKRYCYIWVDGIYTNVRFSDHRLCSLIVVGATEDGHKELVSVESGYRESKESWLSHLRALKRRGFQSPCLAIGDGALGFWSALNELFPETKHQCCWVHKMQRRIEKSFQLFIAFQQSIRSIFEQLIQQNRLLPQYDFEQKTHEVMVRKNRL